MKTKKDLIILFGSQARGSAGQTSDVDVAILSDHSLRLEEKIETKSKIAEKMKISEDSIDLVDLWDAPPLLQHQIATEGKLLEGEEFDFLRFKILAWKRYQDTAKLRRLREESLSRRYAK